MSARDALVEIAHGNRGISGGSWTNARALVDLHQAEVLNEMAALLEAGGEKRAAELLRDRADSIMYSRRAVAR